MAGMFARERATILDVLDHWAIHRSDAPAYTFVAQDGSEQRSISFLGLHREVERIAAHLASRIETGDRVLLAFPSGIDFIVAFLGVLRAGAVAVPTSLPRKGQSVRRLSHVASNCNARVIVGASEDLSALKTLLEQGPAQSRIPESVPEYLALESMQEGEFSRGFRSRSPGVPEAMIQYTSGSTGSEKGVIVSHANLLDNQDRICATFGHGDHTVFAGWLPLFHDMGLIGNILQPLYLGVHCALCAPSSFLQRPALWLELISRYGATTSGGPNFAYDYCASKIADVDLEGIRLDTWQVAFNGSEPLRAATLERFVHRFAPRGFRPEAMRPCYGLAEATLLVSVSGCGTPPVTRSFDRAALADGLAAPVADAAGKSPSDRCAPLVSAGRVCSQESDALLIVDSDTRRRCPEHRIGEIWLRSKSVAQGYWANPELTREVFGARVDGEEQLGAYLRTGDLGFVDARGELFISGRLRDLIIVRGRNYYPQDVELSATESHPWLSGTASAFTLDDGQVVVLAELERSAVRKVQTEALGVTLADGIRNAVHAAQQLVPDVVALVRPGALPRTTSGKIRRSACKEQWLAEKMTTLYSTAAKTGVAGAGQGEVSIQLLQELRALTARVLKIDVEAVVLDRSLVGQGIDSLGAAELAQAIRSELCCETSLDAVLACASLLELSQGLALLPAPTLGSRALQSQEQGSVSESEAAFVFAQEACPNSSEYTLCLPVQIRGELDAPALAQALEHVLREQPSLGMCFARNEQGLLTRAHIASPSPLLACTDARSWDRARERVHIEKLARSVLDVFSERLFRAELVERTQGPMLVLVAHHAVLDLWSAGKVLERLLTVYSQLRGGGRPQLMLGATTCPAVSSTATESRAYWQTRLADLPAPLDLSVDTALRSTANRDGNRLMRTLSPELTQELRAFCRAHDVTLFTLLLSAYRLLLWRHTGQRDVVVGSPVSERDGDASVLCRVNTIPLRVSVQPNLSVREDLSAVRAAVLEAMPHRHYAFARLVHDLGLSREGTPAALLQTMYALQRPHELPQLSSLMAGDDVEVEIGGVTLSGYPLLAMEVPFALGLMVIEAPDRLYAVWEHQSAAIATARVDALSKDFERIVRDMLQAPEAPVEGVAASPSLPAMLHTVDPECDLAEGVHEAMVRQMVLRPDAVALRTAGSAVSYGKLDVMSAALAALLLERGLASEDRVAVDLDPGPAQMAAIVGILRAGGAYLAIDPTQPPARTEAMRKVAGCRFVITAGARGPSTVGVGGGVCDRIGWPLVEGAARRGLRPREESRVHPEHLAYVAFTSGSTGEPKGVMISHRAASNFGAAQRKALGVDSEWSVLQLAALGFDASLSDLLMTLPIGASLCIVPKDLRFPGAELADFIVREQPQLITATASALLALPQRTYPGVRAIISTGEAGRLELSERWAGEAVVYNGYGPTETTIGATLGEMFGAGFSSGRASIGQPFANYAAYVTSPRSDLLPVGALGELCVGGLGLARGYLNQPALTAECFLPDPFCDEAGARMYRTGDLSVLREAGHLQCLGRVDRQLKIRGFRVEPDEVAAHLRTHEDVQDCFVEGVKTTTGEQLIVAYVLSSTPGLSADALRTHLRTRVPSYMIPTRFARVPFLAVGTSGKVDPAGLALSATSLHSPGRSGDPRSALEREVSAAFAKVLGTSEVSLDAHFFDLGGHSLKLAELKSELSGRCNVEVPLLELFDYPTVRSLAARLSQGHSTQQDTRRPTAGGERRAHGQEVAIIGMALRFPGADSVAAFWQNLTNGVESIRFFAKDALVAAGLSSDVVTHAHFVPARGAIDDIELFDAQLFEYSVRDAELLDPQHRLLLECAQQAFDDAGYDPTTYTERHGGHIGAYVGTSKSSYFEHCLRTRQELLDALGPLKSMLGTDRSFAATTLGYKLNLSGPCVNIDTACSTSLVAVHHAVGSLLLGECDIALAGGASVDVPVVGGHLYEEGNIASPDGHCRAFDAAASGTVKGMGAGLVLLKRLDRALADGDQVYAVIRGSAINNDGSQKLGFTAPATRGQASAIRRALERADVPVETVGFVEAHGTGTALGDPVEVHALNDVFAGLPPRSIPIGSVKSNIGHLDAAAGVASLIKATLAVHYGEVPATLHLQEENPKVPWSEGPFVAARTRQPFPSVSPLRRACVSSFGIGGTNAHVVLEQSPSALRASERRSSAGELVVLSARSADSLRNAMKSLSMHLNAHPSLALEDVAFTLATGRRSFGLRRAFACESTAELMEQLEQAERVTSACTDSAELVFLCGSEPPSWPRSLLSQEPIFRAAFESVLALLALQLGECTLADFLHEQQRASAPANLQRCLAFATGYALNAYLRAWGVSPSLWLGEGGGRVLAACLCGALTVEQALALAHGAEDSAGAFELPEHGLPSGALSAGFLDPSTGETLRDASAVQACLREAKSAAPTEETLDGLVSDDARVVIELGSASELRRRLRQRAGYRTGSVCTTMPLAGSRQDDRMAVLGALQRLCETSNCVDPARFYALRQDGCARVRLPGYIFDRRRYWLSPDLTHASSSVTKPKVAAMREVPPEGLTPEALGPEAVLRQGEPATIIADAFAALLGVPAVGPNDDFYQLGGDSLLAARLCTRLKEQAGIVLTTRQVLEHPSAGELARLLPSDELVALENIPESAQESHHPTRASVLPVALSDAQLGLFLSDQVEGVGAALNLPAAIRLRGPLDTAVLHASLHAVLARHSALTSHVERDADGTPQLVQHHVPEDLVLPIAEVAESDLEGEVSVEAERAFDLQRDLLIRARLLRLSAQDHVLVVVVHHLVADGWSLQIIVTELAAAYAQRPVDRADRPLPLQFADYLRRRQLAHQPVQHHQQLQACSEALLGLTPSVMEPESEARGSAEGQAATERCVLDQSLTRAVRAQCSALGVTPYVFLLTAFDILISRYCEQQDVALLTPVGHRPHLDSEAAVGLFVNLLIHRVTLSSDMSFATLVRRVHQTTLDAFSRQDIPFEQVLALHPVERTPGRPVLPIAFAWRNAVPARVPFGTGLHGEPLLVERRCTRFDLTAWLDDSSDIFECAFEYRTGRFQPGSVRAMLRAFEALVSAATRDVTHPVGSLGLLDRASLDAALQHVGGTQVPRSNTRRVEQRIALQAEQTPDAVALIFQEQRISYASMVREARRLAQLILAACPAPHAPVAVCLERSPQLVMAILAILKTGRCFLPLDPSLPAERLRLMLEDAGVAHVVTCAALRDRLPADATNSLQVILCDGTAPAAAPTLTCREPELDDLAYVMFTSGSTGRPKGAMVSHRALENRLDWMIQTYSFAAETRTLHKTPISFDVSLWEVFCPLMSGGTMVIAEPGRHRDPRYCGQLMRDEGVHIAHFVPSMLRVFLESNETTLPELRWVICSGEGLSKELARQFERSFGTAGARLANLYGPTEAAIDVSFWNCTDPSPTDIVPIGRPIDNLRLYVLDATLQLLPGGAVGELYIAGMGLGRGYVSRPGLSAASFIPDPFSGEPGGRMYRTGDRARVRADASIEFLGRTDHQVKLRGFRVELQEIEAALAGSGLVSEAAVSVCGTSSETATIVAHAVPSSARAPVLAQLVAYAAKHERALTAAQRLPNGLLFFGANKTETDFLYDEIFVHRHYLRHGISLADGACVVDVGANVGLFAAQVGSLVRNAQVIAFEPAGALCSLLEQNLAIYSPHGRVCNLALSDREGIQTFTYYPHNTILSSVRADRSRDGAAVSDFLLTTRDALPSEHALLQSFALESEQYEVRTSTLSAEIDRLGLLRIDLLKIDAEMSELAILLGIRSEHWPLIAQVVVEAHDENGEVKSIRTLLESHGFIVNTEVHPTLGAGALQCVYAVREGALDRPSVLTGELLLSDQDSFAAALRRALARVLPEYMVPQEVRLVAELPKSYSGKLDRAALSSLVGLGSIARSAEMPATPTEIGVAKLWQALLKREDIDVDTSFFELGASSLTVIRFTTAVRRQLGRALSLEDAYIHATVRKVAAFLDAQAQALSVAEIVAAPEARFEPFPLTEVQQAYWLGRTSAFEMGNVATHGYLELDVAELSLSRFSAAMNALIRRHDMLRAVVTEDGRQRILSRVPEYQPAYEDLSPAEDLSHAIDAVREDMSHTVFDLSQWPSFEVRVSKLVSTFRIHFSIDALAVDGVSALLLARDLSRVYAGHEQELPALPSASFRDYVMARNALRESAAYVRARNYWIERIDTLPGAPRLPLAVGLAEIASPHFTRRCVMIDAARWRALQAHAGKRGLTASAVVLAAYCEVLAIWSNTRHFLVNLPVSERGTAGDGLENVVGNFTRTLLLEVDVREPASFSDAARVIHAQLFRDLSHSAFDGIELQRARARRGATITQAHAPIVFTGMLGYAGDGEDGGHAFDLGKDVFGITQTPQVLLDVTALERQGELLVNCDSVDAAFPEGVLDQMCTALRDRLSALAGEPAAFEASFGRLMRADSVCAWTREAPIEQGTGQTLHGLFMQSVRRHPERVAVSAGASDLTFYEVDVRARGLAERLKSAALLPGEYVAVVMDKGWEQVVATLGILMAGGAYMPIDTRVTQLRREEYLDAGKVRIVVTQPHLANVGQLLDREVIVVDSALAAPEGLEITGTGDNVAYVIFTSGSTGAPKGVVIDHRGAVNTVLDINQRFGVTEHDAVLAVSSLGFDLSVYDIFGVLAAGGKVVFPDPMASLDPESWVEIMVRAGVTLWNTVPMLMQHLVEYLEVAGTPERLSLRQVLLSGDWVPVALADRIRDVQPCAQVVSLGGATEASIWSIYFPIDVVDPSWRSIPYGRALAGQGVLVLDATLTPCPTWVAGELYIAGIGLACGYLGDAALTAERFIIHPENSERLYRTGDLGRYLPDGNIEFLGRQDTQIKIQGYRLELGEVESLIAQHAHVERAVVVPEREGREVRSLVAYLTLSPDVRPEQVTVDDVVAVRTMDAELYQQQWLAVLRGSQQVATQQIRPEETAEAGALRDRLIRQYQNAVVQLMTSLGLFLTPGTKLPVDEIMASHRIAPRYRRWLDRALSFLEERGVVTLQGETVETCRSVAGLYDPSIETPALPLLEMLTENIHSAESYASEETAGKYQEYFAASHQALSSVLEHLGTRWSTPPRVLEVGAGYGSLTAHVLPRLPPGSSFAFTDISPFFLDRAKALFEDYNDVEYLMFDMDVSPELQGRQRNSYDLILASSVLHNARDLKKTIQHMRTLLAPGGMLLLIEETRFFPFFDLGMGLQQGFDGREDEAERPAHPLISRERWCALLRENGFPEARVIYTPGTAADVFHFDVVVAQSALHAVVLDEGALARSLAQKLPAYVVPRAFIVLDALPLNATGKVNRAALALARPEVLASDTSYVAPSTPLEIELSEIWKAVLRVERVGTDDHFLRIGGDSLLAAKVAITIRARFAIDFPIRALFEATLGEVAQLVSLAQEIAAPQPAVSGFEGMLGGEV